jgi:hypothetical protein
MTVELVFFLNGGFITGICVVYLETKQIPQSWTLHLETTQIPQSWILHLETKQIPVMDPPFRNKTSSTVMDPPFRNNTNSSHGPSIETENKSRSNGSSISKLITVMNSQLGENRSHGALCGLYSFSMEVHDCVICVLSHRESMTVISFPIEGP